MEPVGLRSSSLAHNRTSGDGDSRGRPTSGVPPTESSRLSNRISAAGDGRQHDHHVAVLDAGLEPTGEADVLVVDIHVDEAAQLARLALDDALLQARVD